MLNNIQCFLLGNRFTKALTQNVKLRNHFLS